MDALLGMKVVPTPQGFSTRRPNVQITPSFPYVSDKFRAEWNAWALERFGSHEVAFMIDLRAAFGPAAGRAVVMNPHAIAMLKMATPK